MADRFGTVKPCSSAAPLPGSMSGLGLTGDRRPVDSRSEAQRDQMESLLVTGGAGFIGSNFVRLALARTEARVIVLDALTYAGSLESLVDVAAHPRYAFVRADITDRAA